MADAIARFSVSPETYAQLARVLNPKQMDTAIKVAVRRTIARGRQIAAKTVQERLNVQRKYIDSPTNRSAAIKTFVPPGGASGSIFINQVKMPMSAFKARQTKSGVVVTIDKAKPSRTFRHAFIATVRTAGLDDVHEGHRGVFERSERAAPKVAARGRRVFERSRALIEGKLTKDGFAGRLHIDELFGPSILDFFSRDEIREAILRDIGNELPKQIDSQVNRFLKGRAKTLADAVAQLDAIDSSTDASDA